MMHAERACGQSLQVVRVPLQLSAFSTDDIARRETLLFKTQRRSVSIAQTNATKGFLFFPVNCLGRTNTELSEALSRTMEDEEEHGAPRSGVEAPFSEMMRQWLDEGDRLGEGVSTIGAGGTSTSVPRLQQILESIRELARRHRLILLAGIGMLPLLVFTVAHRIASAPAAQIAAVPERPPPAFVPERMVRPISAAAVGTPMTAALGTTSAATMRPVAPAPPVAAPPVAAPPVAAPPGPVAAAPVAAPPAPVAAAPAPVAAPPVAAPPVAALVLAPSSRQICESEVTRERPAKALAACQRVVDAEPRSPDALVLLARANLIAGRESQTLSLARRAAEIDPRCAEAFLLIGNVDQTLGHKPDARAAYQTYLRLAPHGAYAADVRAIVPTL
jgi:hypothetical protein